MAISKGPPAHRWTTRRAPEISTFLTTHRVLGGAHSAAHILTTPSENGGPDGFGSMSHLAPILIL